MNGVIEDTKDETVKKTREKSVRYPANNLKECVDFLSIVHSIGGRKDAPIESILSKLNLTSSETKSFKYLVSSAEIFGLIEKTNNGIKPTDMGTLILYPPNGEEQKRALLIEVFKTPQLYQKIIERYDNMIIPNNVILKNVFLHQGIATKALDSAVDAFINSANYANVLNNNRLLVNISEEIKPPLPSGSGENHKPSEPPLQTGKKPEPIPQELINYYKLEIPTSSGKMAIIQLPKECDKQDLEKLKKLLDAMCGD